MPIDSFSVSLSMQATIVDDWWYPGIIPRNSFFYPVTYSVPFFCPIITRDSFSCPIIPSEFLPYPNTLSVSSCPTTLPLYSTEPPGHLKSLGLQADWLTMTQSLPIQVHLTLQYRLTTGCLIFLATPQKTESQTWRWRNKQSPKTPPMHGNLFFWGVARRMRHHVCGCYSTGTVYAYSTDRVYRVSNLNGAPLYSLTIIFLAISGPQRNTQPVFMGSCT